MTDTARRLLRELAGLDEPSPGVLPTVVSATASRAREQGAAARARVYSLGRRYLGVTAERLPGKGPRGDVAVVVEPARPDEIAAAMLYAVPMTPRERSVAALVVQGRSTAEMALALGISKWTVQDHLKVVFDRLGVRSRRELVSRLRGA
jgi:DNA-binding CsgD family transcriptional regulator